MRIAASPEPVSPGDHIVTGTVRRATYAGDVLQYDVSVGPHSVLVESATEAGETLLAAGTQVTLRWRVADTLVFAGTA
jgi:putative spermidine/putrescine transport system ATP-binding protein